MVNILLSNLGGTDNVGVVMMIKALMQNIDSLFFVHHLTVCRDYRRFGIKYTWLPRGFDVALDLGGDTFTLYYGILQFLRHCMHLLMHVVFRQPFCLFAQTFSEYGRFTRAVALFFLKRALFVTVREQRSADLLRSMGVCCHLTADLAFLLYDESNQVKSNQLALRHSSYHVLIDALLDGRKVVWNGKRANNFKFDIFKKPVDLLMMKNKAMLNIDLLFDAIKK